MRVRCARPRYAPSVFIARQIVPTVQWTANADVHGGILVEQLFLGGAAKRCAVGVRGTEVGIPCIEMRIEVHQGDLADNLVDRTQ